MENQLTSSDYYLRDQQMGLDSQTQYISNLKKLGYWQYDRLTKIDEFVKHLLVKFISDEIAKSPINNYSKIFDLTIGSFITKIKSSEVFKLFLLSLDELESRSKILSECGYERFYDLCTREELEYLGW